MPEIETINNLWIEPPEYPTSPIINMMNNMLIDNSRSIFTIPYTMVPIPINYPRLPHNNFSANLYKFINKG